MKAPENDRVPGSVSPSQDGTSAGVSPPSLCVLCTVPETPKERACLETVIGLIVRADPGLLRPEILWVGVGDSAIPDLFPELSTRLLRPAPGSRDLLPEIRSFLNSRSFDLVEPRLLEPALCHRIQKLVGSAVPGRPLEAERVKTPLSPAFYRTFLRDRAFRKERKRGIPLLRSAVGSFLSRSEPAPKTLRILMYHRVADTLETDILAVTPFAFTAQMRWLREEGWVVLALPEALRRLEAGTLPPKTTAITFDDGYRDNYEEAAPILSKFGFSATIFPVTAFVLEETEHRRYRGRSPKIPYLTIDQIRELKKAGFDFGGHTHTHPLLTSISFEEAQEEIFGAKKLLEQWTGEKSTLFAYPNGVYGKEHFRILDALGYEAALTVRPGANHPGTFRFALLRTEVSGRDSLGDFIRKMNGGFDLMHRVTQSVRGFYR